MQTSVSGSKSKERGFKIFRGIGRHPDGRRLDPQRLAAPAVSKIQRRIGSNLWRRKWAEPTSYARLTFQIADLRGLAESRSSPFEEAIWSRMPPCAWRPGLEPAELSFRVPHFFHQTRRGHSRGDDPL
jgi:hypothetical protein